MPAVKAFMPAVKAFIFLSFALTMWLPAVAVAQAPPRPAPTAPRATPEAAPKPAQQGSQPEAARPPVGTEPEATTATYGDWLLRCQRVAAANAAAHRVCDVARSVQAQGQQNPIMQLSIGPGGPKEMKLTLVAPVNISFPSVARVAVDEKDPQLAELTWRRCVPGGCFAELEIKDDLIKRWRAQEAAGVVKIVDAAGREIGIPFSFRGFAQALDALLKS
jgi:invasion protein IalB